MKRNQNFPILILVIGVVALLAFFARPQSDLAELSALEKDMATSLSRLWGAENQTVQLTAQGNLLNAQVSVNMPSGLRTRQQRWNYPFLRFVAGRQHKYQLRGLEITHQGTHQPIPEYAMNGMLAERAYQSIGPGQEEERFCEMTSRQLSLSLSRQLGDGNRELVLVDAQEPRSARPQVYGKQAAGAVPRYYNQTMMLNEVCVVVDHEVKATEWERFKQENPALNGCRFRVVTLL